MFQGHRYYEFCCCFRWLAKDEDDGLIVRELPLGGTSLLNSMFGFFFFFFVSFH